MPIIDNYLSNRLAALTARVVADAHGVTSQVNAWTGMHVCVCVRVCVCVCVLNLAGHMASIAK